MELTDEQKSVLDGVKSELSDGSNSIKVSGYAGTGKTTLAVKLREEIEKLNTPFGKIRSVAFVSLTGKASSVLREKIGGDIFRRDYIGTIHSLIYKPKKEFNGVEWVLVGWEKAPEIPNDLIIIDEASMIDGSMVKDLESFGVPVVYFGDSFQLPPVGSENDWLLKDPDYKLKDVQRQALQNPIIRVANQVRKKGSIKPGIYSESVFKIPWNDNRTKSMFYDISFDRSTIALVAKNKTRVSINKAVRNNKGFGNVRIAPGDRLVCLYNNKHSGLMNGQLGTVLWSYPESKGFRKIDIELDLFENIYTTVAPIEFFDKEKPNITHEEYKKHFKRLIRRKMNLDFFDYGYALTVHKSQGSEWDRVILFEERMGLFSDEFFARWLYTGVTRSINKLFITY